MSSQYRESVASDDLVEQAEALVRRSHEARIDIERRWDQVEARLAERERERSEFVRLVVRRNRRAILPIYASYVVVVVAAVVVMALAPELPVIVAGVVLIAAAAVGAFHGSWLLNALAAESRNRRPRA